jgi:hypothetical protein
MEKKNIKILIQGIFLIMKICLEILILPKIHFLILFQFKSILNIPF